MACLRSVSTKQSEPFGDMLCRFIDWVSAKCTYASRVDFIFYTYIDGSIKDSERIHREKSASIEVNTLQEDRNTRRPFSISFNMDAGL